MSASIVDEQIDILERLRDEAWEEAKQRLDNIGEKDAPETSEQLNGYIEEQFSREPSYRGIYGAQLMGLMTAMRNLEAARERCEQ